MKSTQQSSERIRCVFHYFSATEDHDADVELVTVDAVAACDRQCGRKLCAGCATRQAIEDIGTLAWLESITYAETSLRDFLRLLTQPTIVVTEGITVWTTTQSLEGTETDVAYRAHRVTFARYRPGDPPVAYPP